MNNSPRIFDRNQYQKKTIDTYEILAAYFIDVYYNHLYSEAIKLRTNKSVTSVTEGYKHALNSFLQGIENPKTYKRVLIGIHDYFIANGYTNISFSECIERITEEFLPKDFFTSVVKQQKLSVLKLVISQANKVFIEKLVKNYLTLVIDMHKDADNIRVLQDVFIDNLILEREGMYHRFISTQTKNVKSSAPQTALISAMQLEIKKLCTEKFELKKITTSLKKIIINKETELVSYRGEIAGYKNKIYKLERAAMKHMAVPVVPVAVSLDSMPVVPRQNVYIESDPESQSDKSAQEDEPDHDMDHEISLISTAQPLLMEIPNKTFDFDF